MEWDPMRPGAPPTPSSLSSGNSGGASSARAEKTPNFKQLSPSSSIAAISRTSDKELRMKGVEELVGLLRRVEGDYKSLLGEHGSVVKEVNRRLQIFVLETRDLRETCHKLQEDSQELRDLCCFLDDDRQRGRKLAREWQRFGRYTASVMRSEVAVYQEKLKELEERQSELITENMDLKELCLYLDQERLRTTGDRDEGDGSSNGTIAGQEDTFGHLATSGSHGLVAETSAGSVTPTPSLNVANYPTTPSSTASYIKELEKKIGKLEEEKRHLALKVSDEPDEIKLKSQVNVPEADGSVNMYGLNDSECASPDTKGLLSKSTSGKPEAVVHAMKVLEVHEELEKTPTEEDLEDPEKAIVREMCNVVWRKLGDVGGDVGNLNESGDDGMMVIGEPPSPSYRLHDQRAQPPQISGPSHAVGSSAFGNVVPSQGRAHSYNVPQPQPQMASTPLASAMLNPGGQRLVPQALLEDNNTRGNLKVVAPPQQHADKGQHSTSSTSRHLYQGSAGDPNLPWSKHEQPRQPLQHNPQQQELKYPRPSHGYGQHISPSNQATDSTAHSGPSSGQAMNTPPLQPQGVSPRYQPPYPQQLRHSAKSPQPSHQPRGENQTREFPPPSSPTKFMSEHLPFSHPDFQHNPLPPQPNTSDQHSQHRQTPSQWQQQQYKQSYQPIVDKGGGDHQNQIYSNQQQQNKLPFQQPQQTRQQTQPYQQIQQHQRQKLPSQHQNKAQATNPPVVRLLGAPGHRSSPVEDTVASSGGMHQQQSQPHNAGFTPGAPGGPPQELPVQRNLQHAPLRHSSDTNHPPSSSNHQTRQRQEDLNHPPHSSRGETTTGLNQVSSMSETKHPPRTTSLAHFQDGLRASGFRAYNPHFLRDPPGVKRGQPLPPHQQTASAQQGQNKRVTGKVFKEQEWRQTYLDDSDTL